MLPELHPTLLRSWSVLIIEDDPGSMEVATIILEAYGATVHQATHGEQGLALARQIRPRFILSDISMPEMDGWELIKVLKNDLRTREIPVIALTAHAMAGYRERAIASGFHNYLTKPLTPETFIQDLLVLLVDIPDLVAAFH